MPRLKTVAAALVVIAVAVPGCSRNRDAPVELAPSRMTTIGVNAYLWRASLVFVSPVFATRSHPGAPALGLDRAKRLAEAAGAPAIALGGMNARRFAELEGLYGWAGIDAWLGDEDA